MKNLWLYLRDGYYYSSSSSSFVVIEGEGFAVLLFYPGKLDRRPPAVFPGAHRD